MNSSSDRHDCERNRRLEVVREWNEIGGAFILSYSMLLNLCRLEVYESDIIICDEGHILKNENTQIYRAMHRFSTVRRILLTGTPMQNNLKECK